MAELDQGPSLAPPNAEARALLKRPDLLDCFLETSVRHGCVGEDTNKKLLYLAFTSRKLKKPISVVVKGESASGKSCQALTISKFFPPKDMLDLSGMSAKALLHYKDPLEHKVLLIMEHAGAEAAEYAIRTLQSEGRLDYLVTTQVAPGQFVSERKHVEGPVSFIVTTNRSELDGQNENRCFTIYADESEEQTKSIHEAQRVGYLGTQAVNSSELDVWRCAQQLLEPKPVLIPYADLIEFPTKPLRVRRDHPRFLSLIETSAFLHQHQRHTITLGQTEYIEATVDDYRTAHNLAVGLLPALIEALPPMSEKLVEQAQANCQGTTFTVKHLEGWLKWDRKTVYKYVGEAVKAGHIEVASSGLGVPTRYRLNPDKPYERGRLLLLSPEELMEKIEQRRLSKQSRPEEMAHGQVNP